MQIGGPHTLSASAGGLRIDQVEAGKHEAARNTKSTTRAGGALLLGEEEGLEEVPRGVWVPGGRKNSLQKSAAPMNCT